MRARTGEGPTIQAWGSGNFPGSGMPLWTLWTRVMQSELGFEDKALSSWDETVAGKMVLRKLSLVVEPEIQKESGDLTQ